jgi:hypothetical protein
MSIHSSQIGSCLRTNPGAVLLCGLRLLLPGQGS